MTAGASKIIDLDELLTPDKRVQLAGKTYTLPGDVPVEMVLRHQRTLDLDQFDAASARRMYDDLLGLFRYKQPKLTDLPLTRRQLLFAVRWVYVVHGASTDLVDLDVFAGGDAKKARLAGKTYTLPADIPVKLWLAIDGLTPDDHSDREVIQGIYDAVLELFRTADPNLDRLDISINSLIRSMVAIYSEPDETPVPPTRRRTRTGSPSRGGSRPTRKRSSSPT